MDEAKEERILCVISESESESSSDDSDTDPSFCVLEETRAKFSNLAIKKKAKARVVQENSDETENVEPEVDEVDEKSFEEVQRIIRAGQIEKLKVEQCKVYLRKSGLRLTGNKATLIQRIREHLEVVNGGGERKYPASSFFMNCKGDACTGDVVLFEQNVYDMFNIASRSANGPPCGTRMVAGRIVKESYGAAKQQHTFTIEVLWSKGEQPLPPLHPLLIKGRNLYRLKTLRQKWEDEGERRKILMEKHSRGFLARSDRETRIQEKEKRKMLRANRISNKEAKGDKNQSQFDSTLMPKPSVQPQNLGLLVNSRNTENQAIRPQQLGFSSKPETKAHQAGSVANPGKEATQPQAQNPGVYVHYDNVTTKSQMEKDTIQYKYIDQPSRSLVENRSSVTSERTYSGIREVMHTSNQPHSRNKGINFYSSDHMNWTRGFPERTTHRQPLTSMNNYVPTSTSRREYCAPQKLCRYYPQGRCYYGERCKFSHVIQEEYEQRREERWPHDQSRA